MSEFLDDMGFDKGTPRVNAVIRAMMKRFPGIGIAAQARYYEEVHQELAPLARQLELENEKLRGEIGILREAARRFHNLTQGDSSVIIRAPSAEKRDAIIAAGVRLRAALVASGVVKGETE